MRDFRNYAGIFGVWAVIAAVCFFVFSMGAVTRPANIVQNISMAADVSASSGNIALDGGNLAFRKCAATGNLTVLSGGTTPDVDFDFETSPDNSTWFKYVDNAACTAACEKSDFTDRPLHRHVRIFWVTTGTPTTATADLALTCRR